MASGPFRGGQDMISRVFHAHRPSSWTSSHAFFPVGPCAVPTGMKTPRKPSRWSRNWTYGQTRAPFGGRKSRSDRGKMGPHRKRLPTKRHSEAAERPTWGCLRGRSPFIRPPGGQLRSSRGKMGARKRRQRDAVSFCVAPGGMSVRKWQKL